MVFAQKEVQPLAADGSVVIQIDGDDSGFEKTLKGLKSVASSAVKGLAAGAAAATAGVVALGKAALDSYASYEQLVGGVDTLFKESSAAVQQYAANAYKTAGVSANTYMEQATAFSASLIQSLGGDTQAAAQYANQAIMDMSDNANKMGTNIESIQATYQSLMRGNYAMLDNLKLGYGGTKKELERLVADAEKLTGKALDPSKFSDIITAIHAVQENLGITGTTALEAASTIEGSLNMTKAAWSNLLTGIADDNADFDRLVENFVASVETAADNILPRLQIIFSGIGALITELAPKIAQGIPTLLGDVLPELVQAAGSMLTAFGSALIQNLPVLMSSATSLVTGFLTYLQTNLPQLVIAAGTVVQTIGAELVAAAPQLLSAALVIMQNLAAGIAANLPTLIPAALSMLTEISGGLRSGVGQLVDGALAIVQAIGTGIIQSLPALIESVPQIVTNIAGIINDNAPKLIIAAANLIGQLAVGLVKAIPTLVANIPQIIEAIVAAFMAFNWIDLGKTIITALKDGIVAMVSAVQGAAGNVLSAINNTLRNLPATLLNLGKQGIQGLINGIKSLLGAVASTMSSIAAGIINGVRSLPSQLLNIGKQIIQGLINGIKAGASGVVSAIGGVVSSAVSKAKSMLGIHSPSRVFRDQIGWMIAQGMALGIQKGEQQVLTVADQLNNKLIAKEEELIKNLENTNLDEATKQALTSQLSAVKEFRNEYEDALSDIQNAQESMADRLRDYGDLFTTVRDEAGGSFIELGDLQADIDAINRYGDALQSLKARGVSDSLLDEITSMSVDEATAYTEQLLGMTDEQYTQYMSLWQQKQQAAKQIATQFYRDEMDALGKEFVDKIPIELDGVKDEMRNIGVQGIQGMVNGMYSQSGFLYQAAASIVSQAIAAMRTAADIHSPSKKAAQLVGAPLAQGVGVGFEQAYPDVMQKLRTAFDASMAQTSARLQRVASSAGSTVTREVTNNNTTIDRVLRIEVTGDDSEFVRWLRRKIKEEDNRVGPALA